MDNEILKQQSPAVTFEEKGEDTGSFVAFMSFLRRFILLIVIFAVIGTALGLGLALVKDKKVYTQTKSLVVIAKIDNSSVTTNLSLTEKWWATIQNTIIQPTFTAKATEVYKNEYGGKSNVSKGSINVKAGSGLILTISYSDYDKKVAADKLDAFIKAASEEIQSDDIHYVTADSVEFKPIDRVPETSVSSSFAKYVLLGLVGGLVLGFALAFVIYLFDSTVSSKSELERLTGVAVVAYIDDVV